MFPVASRPLIFKTRILLNVARDENVLFERYTLFVIQNTSGNVCTKVQLILLKLEDVRDLRPLR